MDINTNKLVEAFHEVFKYNYLKKGKFNKWVHDTCMQLKFVRDKSFEQLIKLTKSKFHNKMRVIHDRHNERRGMSFELINRVRECNCTAEYDDSRSTHSSSLSWAQNIFIPVNVNSIVLLSQRQKCA